MFLSCFSSSTHRGHCSSQWGFDLHQCVIYIFATPGCTGSVLCKCCWLWWENLCLGCRGSVPLQLRGGLLARFLCASCAAPGSVGRLSCQGARSWCCAGPKKRWRCGVLLCVAHQTGSFGLLMTWRYLNIWVTICRWPFKGAFQLFLLLFLHQNHPTSIEMKQWPLNLNFSWFLFQSTCINTLQYKPLYFKAAYSRSSQSV